MGVYNLCRDVKEMIYMDEKNGCCCHKTKERSEKEYKDLINRLSRIEGQIRGIKGCVLSGYINSGICGKCST